MAPSLANVEASWVAALKLLNETRKFGNVNATNWVGLQQAFEAIFNASDFTPGMEASVASARNFLAGLLSNAVAANVTFPHLQSYCRHVINAENVSDINGMVDRIFRYMVDNTKSVQTRAFSFGSPSAGGSNVGNGTIVRLNVDQWGFDIENQHVDAKTARCVEDQNSNTGIGEEIFEVYGQSPGPDGLQVSGSGKKRLIPGMSCRSSALSNPSFDQFSGTAAAPTDITSWSSSVTVNNTTYAFDASNYYRKFSGSTPYSLKIQANTTLTQKLSSFNTKLQANVPYLMQLAWNRAVGAGAGTLTIAMGSKTNAVVAAAQAGWQTLRTPSSIGTNCWLKNFNEDDLDITITWAHTSGYILIDDMMLIPGTPFDGGWLWIIGGTTAFLREDKFTYTDTATDAGLINYWLWRATGRYLPSGGSPTWTGS